MSDYTKVNLLDVEDNAPDNPDMSVRFSRKLLDSRDLGVSLFSYGPNYKAKKAHSHKVQEEAYVVVKGSGQVRLDDEMVDLKLWDVLRVAPPVTRAFAAGPDGLELIIVGGPKPEGGDGVMSDAIWP